MVKQTTRDRMIEKASQLIREYGYQNIPLRKLASLLGVTTGAFYKAFENKEELYYQVCLLENQRQIKRLEEQYLDGVSDPLDCIWQIGLFLLSEYETNSQMMDFLFFSPVATEAYRKGELLEIGNKTVVYLDQLPIESQKEKKILLLKLDTFITGYGHFIAKGLEPFDEEVYRSMFNDLLGGYKHD